MSATGRPFAASTRVCATLLVASLLVGPGAADEPSGPGTAAPAAAPLARADLPVLDDPHLTAVPRTAEEAARVAAVTAPATAFDAPEPFEANPGGAGTVRVRPGRDAFSQSQPNLDFEEQMTFRLGNGLFDRLWVAALSSTIASDGLGPLFNARGCQRCHLKDGRGHPPDADGAVSLAVRLGIPMHGEAGEAAMPGEVAPPAPGADAPEPGPGGHPEPPGRTHTGAAPTRNAAAEIEAYLGAHPDPLYGHQIADRSLPGHAAEARVDVEWEEHEVVLAGGEVVSLRRPA